MLIQKFIICLAPFVLGVANNPNRMCVVMLDVIWLSVAAIPKLKTSYRFWLSCQEEKTTTTLSIFENRPLGNINNIRHYKVTKRLFLNKLLRCHCSTKINLFFDQI
jgi:hypothetical protein